MLTTKIDTGDRTTLGDGEAVVSEVAANEVDNYLYNITSKEEMVEVVVKTVEFEGQLEIRVGACEKKDCAVVREAKEVMGEGWGQWKGSVRVIRSAKYFTF